MATKKKVTTTTVEEPIEEVNPQDKIPDGEPLAPPIEMGALDMDPGEISLRKFFSQFGDEESRIRIYKFDAQGRTKYVSECDIDSASELFIQENWGEGKYKLNLFDQKNDYLGSKTIYIGPGKEKPITPVENAPAEVKKPEGMEGQPLLLTMLMESMRNNQQLMIESLRSLASKNDGQEKSSAKELAEIVAILKGSEGDKTNPVKLIADAMPIIKELIGLASRGGAPEPKGWVETAKDVVRELPAIAQGFSMMRTMNQGQPGQPGRPGQPVPPQIKEAGKMEIPSIEGMHEQDIALLKMSIAYLKKQAINDKDPAVFAAFVLQTLDEDQSLVIAKLLDKNYEEVAKLDPDILSNVYRPWFEDFFGSLKHALSQRDDTGGDTGDEEDAAEDAGPGPSVLPHVPADQGQSG